MSIPRKIAASVAVALVVAAIAAPAQGATYRATKTEDGCTAALLATTTTIAPTDIPQAYSETERTKGTKCVLATYVRYTKFTTQAKVYQTSTDYDSYYAHASGAIDSKLVSSAHYIGYDAPASTGRWFTLP